MIQELFHTPSFFGTQHMVFHYGQAVFEGLKAYKTEDGRILLFRPRKNMERINIQMKEFAYRK